MTPSKKGGEMIPERIYDILLNTRTADKITIRFKDGRIIQGALIFNHLKGTGRLINIERETSIDFAVDEIRDLKLQPAAKRATPAAAETLIAANGAAEPAEETKAEETPPADAAKEIITEPAAN
jgi:hypothetical protein